METTNLKPDEAMYNTVLSGCARKGRYEAGMEIFEEMQQAGVAPSNVTLSVLVKLSKRRHLLNKAFELCKEVAEKYKIRLNIHVYNNLIQACIEEGDVRRAFHVLGEMIQKQLRADSKELARTYALLLPACITYKQPEDAASLLELAYGIAKQLPLACGHIEGTGKNFSSLWKVKGGLPAQLLVDTLDGLARKCGEVTISLQLIQDLSALQGVNLPSDLKTRIASLQS